MKGLIYYSSKNNIEKIYKQYFGAFLEEETTTSSGNNFSLVSKLGLSKLFNLFVNAGIDGTVSSEQKKSKTVKLLNDFNDRLIRVVKEIEEPNAFQDVTEISLNDINTLYKFNLPLKVSEIYKPNSQGTFIKVSYESDKLQFEGLTSKENWDSPSLINNILHSSEVNNMSFKAKGLLAPIEVKTINNKKAFFCQFLVIYA